MDDQHTNPSNVLSGMCSNCEQEVALTMSDGRKLDTKKGAIVICNHCGTDLVVKSELPLEFATREGVCPACEIVVNMSKSDGTDLARDIGYVILCDQCGAELEIVKSDPLTFELLQEGK